MGTVKIFADSPHHCKKTGLNCLISETKARGHKQYLQTHIHSSWRGNLKNNIDAHLNRTSFYPMEITNKFSSREEIKVITMMAMTQLFHIYKEKKIPASAKQSSLTPVQV